MENKDITIKQLRDNFLSEYKDTSEMTPLGNGWFSTCKATPEKGSLEKVLDTNPTVRVKDRGVMREGVLLSASYENFGVGIRYDVLFPKTSSMEVDGETFVFLDRLGGISTKNIIVVEGTFNQVTDIPTVK